MAVATILGHWWAMPPGDMPEAAWLMLVPFLLWLNSNPGNRLFWFSTAATGWITWFGLLFWLRNFTHHLEFFGATAVGWLLTATLAAVVAAFWVVWCWLARLLWRDSIALGFASRMAGVCAIAGAWVVLEWVRSWIFTGFPWLPLAASQWQRPIMLQILAYTGSWGLSWALVVFNTTLALYIVHLLTPKPGFKAWYQKLCPDLYFGLAVMATVVAAGWWSPKAATPQNLGRVGFVQPYVQPAEKWDFDSSASVLHDLAEVTRFARILGAQLILWPEAPTPFPVTGPGSLEAWLHNLALEVDVPILGGGLMHSSSGDNADGVWYNAVVLVTPETGVHHDTIYAKRRLVPFGEYVPLARWFKFLNTVVPIEGSLHPGSSPALIPVRLQNLTTLQIGSLICYEDIFSSLARATVKAGADVLFVATNNAWYGEEGGAWQHAAHSVLRAAETRRPLVRSGNAGWSGWIDERGRIRHVVLNEQGSIYFAGADTAMLQRDPALARSLTVYVRFGHGGSW
ncbi:MAG: apolipoprotein N-acyltransferase [Verrucomicrobia bacterium]|nr:apolipoprotein N-acyltransferase [Verrucomicrobiota bacterium]